MGKIDNNEYLKSLSKAQKDLVDNYNASVRGASLENTLKNIGISDRKVFNKLISMSRNQKHTKAPGFKYYVNLYDLCTLIIWIFFLLFVSMLFVELITKGDLEYIKYFCFFLLFLIVRVFIKDKITRSLIINNVYYYLHDFYGIGNDVKDSRGDYEDRMKIKSRAFLLYGTGKMYDQVKSNIYMVGIGEGLEGYKPVLEEDMKPQDYGKYKDPLLISWYIKIVEKVFKNKK